MYLHTLDRLSQINFYIYNVHMRNSFFDLLKFFVTNGLSIKW